MYVYVSSEVLLSKESNDTQNINACHFALVYFVYQVLVPGTYFVHMNQDYIYKYIYFFDPPADG